MIPDKLWPQSVAHQLFTVYGALVVLFIFGGILFEQPLLYAFPLLPLIGYLAIVDFRKLFYLLAFFIPLSTEYYFSSGLATDLPTEPLMVGLMGIFFLWFLQGGWREKHNLWSHPVTWLLLLHLGWIAVTTFQSDLFVVSVKWFLAKTWYIVVFFFLTAYLLRRIRDIERLFWWIFVPLIISVTIVLIRHAQHGFAFADIYSVVGPFYRNHVNYACIMALFYPFVVMALFIYPRKSARWKWLLAGLVILTLGIQFAYTRAAYLSLIIAAMAWLIIELRLMKYVLIISLVALIGLVGYMVNDNTYLEYAPRFERTVEHKKFDNLVEATYKGEDISTMERVYRWVAGMNMFSKEPWFGYGPGNFYNFYKAHTVTSFRTYVSDNPERSGIHSYYLMTLVEQGLPGLLIFLVLSFYILIRGETVFHLTRKGPRRFIILGILLSTIVIDAFLIINDMVETDKVGSFFFMNMALLVNLDILQGSGEKKYPDSTDEPG